MIKYSIFLLNFIKFLTFNNLLYCNCESLNSTYIKVLKSKLFENYMADTIPTIDKPINLSMGIAIRAINNVNQIDGTIDLNIWLRYSWNDYNLIWNESESNISSIILRTDPELDNCIWTPDIYLYNTAENPLENLKMSNAEVNSNGNIFWSRPGIIKLTCHFDLSDFPYDRQRCYIKLGSWSYSGFKLLLSPGSPTVDLENFQENEEWNLELVDFKINDLKYACCPHKYYDITFILTLKRYSEYYENNIIIPTFATASLIIVTLIIPWSSGERISFAITVMLAIIVFLLILSDSLPKSNNTPLLSRIITGLTIFSLFGVLFTVLVSALDSYKEQQLNNKNENNCIKCLFNLCKCIFNNKKSKNSESNNALNNDNRSSYITDTSDISHTSDIDYTNNTEHNNIGNNINKNKKSSNNTKHNNSGNNIIKKNSNIKHKPNISKSKKADNFDNLMVRSNSYSNALNINSSQNSDNVRQNSDTVRQNSDTVRQNSDNESNIDIENNDYIQKEFSIIIRNMEIFYSTIFLILFLILCLIMIVSKYINK